MGIIAGGYANSCGGVVQEYTHFEVVKASFTEHRSGRPSKVVNIDVISPIATLLSASKLLKLLCP